MSPTEDRPHSLPEPYDDRLPEKIGRYVILERLGAGGMGTVYKARDPQLDRVVALKLPRFDVPQRDRAVRLQRFQREARAAAQIWHPHVCPIYDVGEHEGRPYVVMAHVDGQSLADRLAVRGCYENVTEAVGVIRQILDALEAVHAHGIVHRDLKPGNILLDSAGRAILSDFGLARPENDREPLTSDGILVGTPAYMAPEQASGESERIGPWTDLYSLGVVFYEMLVGRLPFTGGAAVVLAHILRDEPPPPRAIRPDLDPALEAIVLRALRKAPSERYPNAPAFRAALDDWSATQPATRTVSATVALAAPTAPERKQRPLAFSPGSPPPRSLARGLGWLSGGVLLTVSMGLLACIPLLLIVGDFGRTIPFGILALFAFLAAWVLWSLLEGAHARKGLQSTPSALLRGLSATALLGALLAICLYWWVEPWPKGISYDEFEQMFETRQVLQMNVLIAEGKHWIEVKALDRRRSTAFTERFLTVPPSTDPNFITDLHVRHPNLRINAISTIVGYAPHPAPGDWVILPMLAFPLAIALLLGHLLVPRPTKRA
jgi:tRNA A-37 threonylcarbamoyl transferase component Bud32